MSASLTVLALLLAPTACVAFDSEPELATVACPVLLGPVLRIGGVPGERPAGDAGPIVTAGATYTETITSQTQGSGEYQTTTTETTENRIDTVSAVFSKSVKGFERPLLHVRTVEIEAEMHISLVAVTKLVVRLTAEPWNLAQEPWP